MRDCWGCPVADNEILQAVRTFLDRGWTGERRVTALEGDGQDDRLFSQAADQGWFALTAPESEDGLGLHPSDLVPMFHLFGERLIPGPMLEQMLLPGLLLGSTPGAAAAEALRGAALGERRVALVDAGATTAWRSTIGSVEVAGDRLTGAVNLVRSGSHADVFVVIAGGTGQGAAHVVIVDAARPGVNVVPHRSGDPASAYARVQFDEVPLEPGDLVATGEPAIELSRHLQSWMRVLISATLAGIGRRMLDLGVDFVKHREQFGRPVGSFQAVKHIAAGVAQRVIMLECFTEAVAEDSRIQDLDTFELASYTLKANASEVARTACEDALQMHGGIGMTYEYELHWWYKHALALRTWYGDERESAIEVGRRKLSA